MAHFKVDEVEKHLVVRLPPILGANLCEELAKEMKSWLLKPNKVHILDFQGVFDVKPEVTRIFSTYSSLLKKNEKYLMSINVSSALLSELRTKGLVDMYQPIKSFEEAAARAKISDSKKEKKPRFKLDSNFLNPFIEGTLKTFKEQIFVDVRPNKPFVNKGGVEPHFDIAGMITMDSDDFNGKIAICFEEEVFLKLYESMLAETYEEINDENSDAAGEVLNIIYGFAKTQLIDKGKTVNKAIPSLLMGEDIKLQLNKDHPILFFPFESTIGIFHLVFNLEGSEIR